MTKMLAILAQAIQSTSQEKMPENAGQTVIYIAMTCIGCLIAMIWFLLRRDTSTKIVTIFAESLRETQKTFKEEADAARIAHAITIDKILAENRAVHQEQGRLLEKTVSEHGRLLEKSVDRITSSLDDIKAAPHHQVRKRPTSDG
jgi:hypothetical protein